MLRRLTGGVSLRLGHGEGEVGEAERLGERWRSSSGHLWLLAASDGTRASSTAEVASGR